MKFLNRFKLLVCIPYFISLIFLAYYSKQDDFISILFPFLIASASYVLLIQLNPGIKIFFWLVISIKIIFIFSFPHLSDDIYRFWWDGFLSSHGYSPYLVSPVAFMKQYMDPEFHDSLLKYFKFLNSSNYITAYPLVCQWIFHFAASIARDDIYIFNIILKCIFLIADGLLIFFILRLLRSLKLPDLTAMWYVANPLCLIELNANLHFEIFLILFFVLSVWYFLNQKLCYSGLTMGFSVVSKMVSFIWLPLMISRPWISRKNVLFLIAALIPLILFIMELPSVQIYQNGLKLYFQKFEFNSFLFGPLFKITGWHHWFVLQSRISFLLMLLFCIIYFILFVKHSIRNEGGFTFRTAWLILFAYLILSTTIHPWYITPLIMLSVFSLRYTGVVWSILIIISYQRYDPYWSAYEWTGWAIEYSLLLVVFAMEYFRGNKLSAEDNFAIRTNA